MRSTTEGDDSIHVDDLTWADLELLAWSGSRSHIRNVAGQLERREAGAIEYLVVRNAQGAPVSKGAIDFEESAGVGTITQLVTHPDYEGRGYAQRLIGEAERRIRERGFRRARLSVEPENTRAVRLYEFMGYQPVGAREVGWEYEREDGQLAWYKTVVTDMDKPL